MLIDTKNLKDTENEMALAIKDSTITLSYTKVNKLITALYMVTDIVERDEPLRNKLRTLGAEIISDINSIPSNAVSKISEIMSFLDIASALNIISQMNCNILKKEFFELNKSISESDPRFKAPNGGVNISEFFKGGNYIELPQKNFSSKEKYNSIGHRNSTSIGVQKGSTLLQAISDKTQNLTGGSFAVSSSQKSKNNFDVLKKERRFNIVNIIKNNAGSATIKDIKNKINEGADAESFCSEKTVQRELMSMIKDGVLYKTGEKRWSKYFIKN